MPSPGSIPRGSAGPHQQHHSHLRQARGGPVRAEPVLGYARAGRPGADGERRQRAKQHPGQPQPGQHVHGERRNTREREVRASSGPTTDTEGHIERAGDDTGTDGLRRMNLRVF